jgi:hypothetical protein
MATEAAQLLAARGIPDAGRLVRAGGQHLFTIGRERHLPNCIGMANELRQAEGQLNE